MSACVLYGQNDSNNLRQGPRLHIIETLIVPVFESDDSVFCTSQFGLLIGNSYIN